MKPVYDLHLLGWQSFQQLCSSITRIVFGQTVQSFLDSNDGGRDGAFEGKWVTQKNETYTGKFVFQCKHFSKAGYNLKLSDLKDEIVKAKKLVEQGRCDVYILLTNAGISGSTDLKIQEILKSVGVKYISVYGLDWLCQQIYENQNIRMELPRLYGIGDLSQILDARAYKQAKEILSQLRDDLAKIIITDSYRLASDALDKYGFVLLIGEPATGKTTIASMLAMASLDKWKLPTIKLEKPEKLVEHWNADNSSQLFWIDDAFGVTQYERTLVREWNHKLVQVKTMINQGVKIVMTSRDYIYNSARNDLKESAFPLFQESKVVIDIHNLSIKEKNQILYNHIKLGNQTKIFIKKIKPFLEFIAKHSRFSPETARRLADPIFTKSLHLSEYHLDQFIDKQESFLQEVLINLDKDSKAAIGIIYMRNGQADSPLILNEDESIAIQRMDSNIGRCVGALESLNGSLVQSVTMEEGIVWRFKHPTIGEAYGEMIIKNPELLEIYLKGTSPEKLMQQTTCGNVNLQNAVIIPKKFFPIVLDRLNSYTSTSYYKSSFLSQWGSKRILYTYLSNRCSKDFLLEYIQTKPELLDQLTKPSLFLTYSPEVELALKLHSLQLLPEEKRKAFIESISKYATDGYDLYALQSNKFETIFTGEEFEKLKLDVHEKLVPRIDEIRAKLIRDFNSEYDAESHMDTHIDNLRIIKSIFKSEEMEDKIENEIFLTKEWISENTINQSELPARDLAIDDSYDIFESERSIFDDIDS